MNRPLNRRSEKLKGNSQWLISFSDLILIVLTLFILLYSFSSLDQQKFQSVLDSFTQSSSIHTPKTPLSVPIQPDKGEYHPHDEAKSVSEVKSEDKIFDVVNQMAKNNRMSQDIISMRTVRGIEVILGEKILFQSGRADLLKDAQPVLDQLAPVLKDIPNEIKVEGYTDNIPISTSQFPSNWELSSARASSVVRYFTEYHHINPERFVVVGYGEHRPFESNETEKGRQANRRVVIVISENK